MKSKGFLVLGFTAMLLACATADHFVHILSKYKQQVTSSTLNWLPLSSYDAGKEIVIGGFETVEESEGEPFTNHAEKSESKKRPLFVCRALHNSIWVSGSQKYGEKVCTVSIHGNVRSYGKYELLENVNNAARLSWAHWDKFHSAPVGAVAIDKMYVARHVAENHEKDPTGPSQRYTHYIGTYDPEDKLGTIIYVKDNGEEGLAESGEVLVEAEPVRYELNAVKLNWPKKRIIKRVPMVIGKSSIINQGETQAIMAKAFVYAYNYSIYWGQGHAILKGLNTTIKLANGTSLPNIMWGMEGSLRRADIHTVRYLLEAGTGINATLSGNYTDMEVPYTATLVSHYEDGATKERQIAGIRREETMMDVTAEFGPMYFLGNFSAVPTTLPPTTTEIPTTFSPHELPKETRKLETSVSDDDDDEDDDDDDENLILPPKKSDISNMQSDDGGPLSLKNKVEVEKNGGSTSSFFNAFPGILVLAVFRIT